MNEGTPQTEPTLPQILYALALALAPFIESLIAHVEAQGRPVTPALHSLRAAAAALRTLATLLGTPPAPRAGLATPHPHPARPHPARHTPARHTPTTRPAHPTRATTPHPRHANAARPARRHPTPQPLRTARL